MMLLGLIAGIVLAGSATDSATYAAEIATLDGKVLHCLLESVGPNVALLKGASPGEHSTVPLNAILRIDFERRKSAKPAASEPAGRVVTVHGTELRCSQYVTNGKTAILTLVDGEQLELPLQQMAGALLTKVKDAEAAGWRSDAQQKRSADVLIIERQGRRHQIEGIVGKVGPLELTFILDQDRLPVKRERVYGILYAHHSDPSEALAAIHDRFGNLWVVNHLEWNEHRVRFTTPSGLARTITPNDLVSIDFSRGRLAYLSDLEPTLVQHTPFFDVNWDYRRDASFSGGALSIAGVEFSKGLAVHSKTVLEYELGRQYRRFDAVVGIDDSAGPLGDAIVRVLGDGKLLVEMRVEAGQHGNPVSVTVESSEKLQLEVDYGNRVDLGDHVVFGNARVVK